jgi:mannose/fructose/N-acetylgalactosamine-specific phosphotransferase system component IIC
MDILWLSILGGIMSLETSYVLQMGFSQPIVLSTILGLIYNAPYIAIKVGVVLQFLLLNKAFGEVVLLPETPVVTILSAFWCIKYKTTNLFLCLAVFVISLLLGRIYRHIVLELRKFNKFFVYRAEKFIQEDKIHLTPILLFSSNAIFFLTTVVYLLICLYFGDFIVKRIYELPIYIKLEEQFVCDVLLLLGLTVALKMFIGVKRKMK